MLAIAHNTYLDYVSYNKSKGHGAFGEDLWNALKEQETDEVEKLEVLKKDFLDMRYKVEYDKYVLGGIAEGLTLTETMHFVDWEDACDWASKVTMAVKVPFVILEMRGPNGEVENF